MGKGLREKTILNGENALKMNLFVLEIPKLPRWSHFPPPCRRATFYVPGEKILKVGGGVE